MPFSVGITPFIAACKKNNNTALNLSDNPFGIFLQGERLPQKFESSFKQN